VRRLSADELVAVASELGAEVTGDVSELTEVQRVDEVVEALALLLVAIVRRRPFDRRNNAVGVASIDLLARLNGHSLDLAPPEDVKAMIARIRDGLATSEVRDWLGGRVALGAPAAGPRCPACSTPLREALATVPVDRITVPTCGACGHVLGQPFRHRATRRRPRPPWPTLPRSAPPRRPGPVSSGDAKTLSWR
jgi:Zn ribbon nucleic-acid-binding protein